LLRSDKRKQSAFPETARKVLGGDSRNEGEMGEMIESPKSLTAVIHVSFHYREVETKATEGGVEALSKLLDQSLELSPEHLELLIKLASRLAETPNKSD